jgi:hypothetical protein
MSRGPGIMQREILRRSGRPHGGLTVRVMARKLFADIDDVRLGAVRRAMQGLVTMGYLKHDGSAYKRTGKPLSQRAEWSTSLDIVPIDWASANELLDGNHYLGAAGYQPTYCVTTPTRDALALFAPPVASHFKKALPSPLELTRLWRTDDCPFPLSQFLSRAIRWIKKEAPSCSCVFSYADPGAINPVTGRPHVGGIYTASNFVFLGEARATDHWLDDDGCRISAARCYRMFKTKSVARIAALKPSWQHVPGSPKYLYVYPLRMKLADVLEAIGGPGSRYNPGDAPSGGRYSPQFLVKLKADLGDLW